MKIWCATVWPWCHKWPWQIENHFTFPSSYQPADVDNVANFANFSSGCNDNRHHGASPWDQLLPLFHIGGIQRTSHLQCQRGLAIRQWQDLGPGWSVYTVKDQNTATFYADGKNFLHNCLLWPSLIRLLWHLSALSCLSQISTRLSSGRKVYFLRCRIWYSLLNKENYYRS